MMVLAVHICSDKPTNGDELRTRDNWRKPAARHGHRDQITEQNSSWWRFSWKFSIRNDGDQDYSAMSAEVNFLNAEKFIVNTTREWGIRVPVGETKEFSGSELIDANVAPTVKWVQVR